MLRKRELRLLLEVAMFDLKRAFTNAIFPCCNTDSGRNSSLRQRKRGRKTYPKKRKIKKREFVLFFSINSSMSVSLPQTFYFFNSKSKLNHMMKLPTTRMRLTVRSLFWLKANVLLIQLMGWRAFECAHWASSLEEIGYHIRVFFGVVY